MWDDFADLLFDLILNLPAWELALDVEPTKNLFHNCMTNLVTSNIICTVPSFLTVRENLLPPSSAYFPLKSLPHIVSGPVDKMVAFLD